MSNTKPEAFLKAFISIVGVFLYLIINFCLLYIIIRWGCKFTKIDVQSRGIGWANIGMLSILSSFNKVSLAWSSSWSNTVLYLLICTIPIDNAVFRIIGLQGFDVL